MDNIDVSRVLSRLQSLTDNMTEMIETAMEDDNISEDEKNLLLNVNMNIEKYAKMVIETIEDGKIEESELSKLKEMERKIKEDAEKIASMDNVVSEEEAVLLKKIVETLETEW